MTREARRIKYDEFAAGLDDILETMAETEEPLLVEKAGKTFRVEIEDEHSNDLWKGYDPEKARQALKASAGALRGVDIAKLKADIYAARGQDSEGRPAPR